MASFLSRVRLKNFKAVSQADVELSLLTVLVGPNSAGKSTLIQSLLLQSQAAESDVTGDLYPLNGPRVRLGDFNDVLWAGAAEEAAGAHIAFGGELAIWGEELEDVGFELPVDALPTYSWDLEFGPAGSESRSAMRLLSSQVLDRGDGFSVSVSASSAPEERHEAFAVSDAAAAWETWMIDVVGAVRPGAGAPEAIAAAALHGGLPQRVLVEAPASEQVALAWTDSARRAMRRTRSSQRDTPSGWDQLRLQLENLESRLSEAQQRGDSEAVAQLETRIENAYGELRLFETSAFAESQREPSQHARRLLGEWAVDDVRRFLTDGVPFASARKTFTRYFADRASASTMPDFPGSELLAEIASDATSELVGGISLAEYHSADLVASEVNAVLSFFEESVRYLGPLRESPRPNYEAVPNPRGGDIGAKGEATAAVLHACRDRLVVNPSLSERPRLVPLCEAVDEWLTYLELGSSLMTADMGRLGIELTVGQDAAGRDLDLTAVGVGVSQALPVLALCLLSEPGSLILLEQPELHLHPATQQRLADFLLSCSRSGRQIIVETHSDHLVSRLRRRIAEDETGRVQSLVGLLSTEGGEHGATYRPIETNELGGIEEWPKGFFDQAATESQAILRAGLAKRKAQEAGEEAL
jgi:predicted ATPase